MFSPSFSGSLVISSYLSVFSDWDFGHFSHWCVYQCSCEDRGSALLLVWPSAAHHQLSSDRPVRCLLFPWRVVEWVSESMFLLQAVAHCSLVSHSASLLFPIQSNLLSDSDKCVIKHTEGANSQRHFSKWYFSTEILHLIHILPAV